MAEMTRMTKMTTVVSGPESPYKPSRIHLSSVNPYITCNLCKGYLIDATTIVECLHSFCHSCIMKHLRTEQYCPQCEMMINKAKPNIKPDATLQAIVYKLVPGLYEKELLRKRAFYRQNPEMAAITTPEQRGEDTEHLIFSPREEFQLSLEYADKELAGNNEELKRPKYLQCPAMVRIAFLKKFIINKYNIPTHLYYVEIMYKVQTITLPDHYTLMDVAYIYTWKKNDSMEFFFRIRTHEMKSVELPEVPLRRSPSISTGRQSSTSALATIKEEESDSADSSVALIKPSDIKREEPNLTDGDGKPGEATITTTTTTMVTVMTTTTATATAATTTAANVPARAADGVSECMVDVKPNVTALGKQQQENRGGNGASTESGAAAAAVVSTEPPKVKKNESIKLKIEMNKNTYVSILQSPQPDTVSKHHKSDKPEKVKKKKSEDKDKSVNKIKSSSDLKIKIEKVKDGLVTVKKDGKSSKKGPYKVELSGISDYKNNNKPFSSEFDTKKAKKEAHKLDKSGKKIKSPKRNLEIEKIQPPIVLKIDQKSPELSTSSFKIISQPVASSSPKPKVELSLEDEKSQFLNSFELTPIKSLQNNQSRSPSCSPGSSSSSSSSNTEVKQGKRKNKDQLNGRTVLKKPKLSDVEMKALVERTVQQNIKSTGDHIVPPPVIAANPVKQELESPPSKTPLQPKSLPTKAEPLIKEQSLAKEVKPKTFDFKPHVSLPPPVVSTTNIPAPKPAQPVMIAPKPQTEPPKRPAVPLFPKPIQPAKKLPHLLPKNIDYLKSNKQKQLEMKRSQTSPPIHISPNKETEISQIKPENARKNIKVYGPPSDGGNFAVPAAMPSLLKPKSNKNRPVNYLNYALMNANKAPAGSRTPIPSYSNSPSYSPDSPQYNPNFNISTKQYKYANPHAYANFLQNMLNDRKTSNVSPPQMVHDKKADPVNERKRPCPSPEARLEPPEKQPKVQSLLNQINIPSSLSITLATEEDEAAREKARKSLPEEDKNYIEILKLPEISITEAERITPPKVHQEPATKKVAKNTSPTKTDKTKPQTDGKNASPEMDSASFQQKFIQSIRVEKEPKSKSGCRQEKKSSPVFTPPSPVPNGNTFKLPNATVLSNGIVKLNSYPELDLINKNSTSPGSTKPMPSPPKPNTPKHVPIAPKPTGTFFPPTGTPCIPPPHRKSLSPPVPKPVLSPGQPKSKTPPAMSTSPSHAALAAMGPMFGLQMNQDNASYLQSKKMEHKPKKSSTKSPKTNALDLSSPGSSAASSATLAADKSKDAMNMLMMNNNLSNAQKFQVANYLNEVAKLNNSGMMMPQMVGMQPNPLLNQMMQALYLQQWTRMAKAGNDTLEK
ncbi:polycomb group protein Psc [Topomyia yanbarensis]|uniref:polycomb group protein Psc n=1 Tax=Topomyia yanbarensis TaxID=2498891 RepID=UPI00273B6CBE|nr:polycomb group protein Psc [Topomyia yanbarensis]